MKIFLMGGAGAVGSSSAAHIAAQGIADEIVLYDLNMNACESYAYDIAQAYSYKFNSNIHAGTIEQAKDADIFVIAAGLPAALATHDNCKDIEQMASLIESCCDCLQNYCPQAVVLTLTNPLDIFNYVLYKASGLDARQFIAVSVNDSLRFRNAIASYFHCPVADVEAYVIGGHNAHKIHLFSSASVNGKSLRDLPAAERNKIIETEQDQWGHFLSVSGNRTASWTTGESCALTVRHICGADKGPICCSYIMGDSLSAGYPVLLDSHGLAGCANIPMSDDEQAAFAAAKSALQTSIDEVLTYTHRK